MTPSVMHSGSGGRGDGSPWRVLIADDEPLACTRLRGLLARYPSFAVVAECGHGAAVIEVVATTPIDVAFLDVRMPKLDGIGAANALRRGRTVGASDRPAVVFVTAYDAHAIRAFDLEAVDYLVKPVDIDRFDRTMQRLTAHLQLHRQRGASSAAHPEEPTVPAAVGSAGGLPTGVPFPARFSVRDAKGIYFVATGDIDRVEADGNYVALIARGRRHLLRETMRRMEMRLDPAHFVRVHRSAIVRIDTVQRLQPCGHGEYDITLMDGTRLTSSRGCRSAVLRLLG